MMVASRVFFVIGVGMAIFPYPTHPLYVFRWAYIEGTAFGMAIAFSIAVAVRNGGEAEEQPMTLTAVSYLLAALGVAAILLGWPYPALALCAAGLACALAAFLRAARRWR